MQDFLEDLFSIAAIQICGIIAIIMILVINTGIREQRSKTEELQKRVLELEDFQKNFKPVICEKADSKKEDKKKRKK